MKSNICKIDNSTKDLAAIFQESERVAEYNGLTHKESLQLRLICEEIDGMLPNIIDEFSGELWFDFEDGVCKVNVSIKIPEFDAEKKENLIAISNDKKNAAAVGIVGKIRNAIENFFLNGDAVSTYDPCATFHLSTGFSDGVDYSYLWSLEQYRNLLKPEKQKEEWDELEKSVIASAADDIIVGIKGNQADIVIVKKFA